jgi:arylsulfatase A
MIWKIIYSGVGMFAALTVVSQPQKLTEKPNVIVFLADDLGWRDLSCTGSRYFETPNIDKLASRGVRFTNAYAACAVCSPTRASIQTGRYPARLGVTDWIRARFQVDAPELKAPEPFEENGNQKLRTPSNPYWMDLGETTLAEVFRSSGYFTCHIGKWHLGPDDFYPEKQGYDLNIAGCDMGQPVNYFDPYRDEKGVGFPNLKPRKQGEYLVDRLADELKTVITKHRNQPFFINMCDYAVHTPLMAKPELVNKYKQKPVVDGQKNPVYAAMIESMDQAVGLMMQTLEENKLLENTIIIFLSDNGGLLGPTDNSPLRSGKGYPYEGGIRIPMIVSWKGKVPEGHQIDLPVSTVDVMPTLCALTKTPLPETEIDGRDISPAIIGKKMKNAPLYWHFPHYRSGGVVPYSIIRDGDWKLIRNYEGKRFELYDLKNDPFETADLANQQVNRVEQLDRKLSVWLTSVHARLPELKK